MLQLSKFSLIVFQVLKSNYNLYIKKYDLEFLLRARVVSIFIYIILSVVGLITYYTGFYANNNFVHTYVKRAFILRNFTRFFHIHCSFYACLPVLEVQEFSLFQRSISKRGCIWLGSFCMKDKNMPIHQGNVVVNLACVLWLSLFRQVNVNTQHVWLFTPDLEHHIYAIIQCLLLLKL